MEDTSYNSSNTSQNFICTRSLVETQVVVFFCPIQNTPKGKYSFPTPKQHPYIICWAIIGPFGTPKLMSVSEKTWKTNHKLLTYFQTSGYPFSHNIKLQVSLAVRTTVIGPQCWISSIRTPSGRRRMLWLLLLKSLHQLFCTSCLFKSKEVRGNQRLPRVFHIKVFQQRRSQRIQLFVVLNKQFKNPTKL